MADVLLVGVVTDAKKGSKRESKRLSNVVVVGVLYVESEMVIVLSPNGYGQFLSAIHYDNNIYILYSLSRATLEYLSSSLTTSSISGVLTSASFTLTVIAQNL